MELVFDNSIYVLPNSADKYTASRSEAVFVIRYYASMSSDDAEEFVQDASSWDDYEEISANLGDFSAGFVDIDTEDEYEELSDEEKKHVDEVIKKFRKYAEIYKVKSNRIYGLNPIVNVVMDIDNLGVTYWNRDAYSSFSFVTLEELEGEILENLIDNTREFIENDRVLPSHASNLVKLIGKPELKPAEVFDADKEDVFTFMYDRENLDEVEKAIDWWTEEVKK